MKHHSQLDAIDVTTIVVIDFRLMELICEVPLTNKLQLRWKEQARR